jgi:hypothetical protein
LKVARRLKLELEQEQEKQVLPRVNGKKTLITK